LNYVAVTIAFCPFNLKLSIQRSSACSFALRIPIVTQQEGWLAGGEEGQTRFSHRAGVSNISRNFLSHKDIDTSVEEGHQRFAVSPQFLRGKYTTLPYGIATALETMYHLRTRKHNLLDHAKTDSFIGNTFLT